jgi:hypothetical protein
MSGLRWVRRDISEEESQLNEGSFRRLSFHNGFTGIRTETMVYLCFALYIP